MLASESLFKPTKSRSQSQFKSIRRLQAEMATNYQTNIHRILTRKQKEFVPFVHERVNGKLVANPFVSAVIPVTSKESRKPAQYRSQPGNSISKQVYKQTADTPQKWVFNSVTSRKQKTSQKTQLAQMEFEIPDNAYSKTNMVIFQEIKSLEPPQSIPNEDRQLIDSLYSNYKKIKEFNVNNCRRRLPMP